MKLIPFHRILWKCGKLPVDNFSRFFPCGKTLIFSTTPVDRFFLQPQRFSPVFHIHFPYGYYCYKNPLLSSQRERQNTKGRYPRHEVFL